MNQPPAPSGWQLYAITHQPRYDGSRIALTDPTFTNTLKQRILYYIRIFVIYSMLLWFVLCVFYGCMYDMTSHASSQYLKIIDMDHTATSDRLVRIMLEKKSNDRSSSRTTMMAQRDQLASPWVPRWKTYGHRGLHTLQDCIDHVRRHEWGAIVINRGLEARLQQALQPKDTSRSSRQSVAYNAQDALTVLVSTGRNPIPIGRYFQPSLDAMAQYAARQYAQHQLATPIDANTADPQALLTPVWYTTTEVSPYSFGIAPIAPLFAVFVSLACTLATQVLLKLSSVELYDVVNHHQLAAAFHLLMLVWSSILGLYSALAFLAFRGPHYSTQHLGLPITAARFLAIFAVFDAAILASSQWIFFWTTVLPPDLVPIALISLMVPSSASSSISLDLIPHGLRWIAAIPAHNSTMLFRTITSGAYPRVALNLGVLAAEIAFMFLVNLVVIMVRQDWLISGFVDGAGWYKSSIFYRPPPKYVAGQPQQQGVARPGAAASEPSLPTVSESPRSSSCSAVSETPSRHTINIMDDSETPEGLQYTLYGI